jgi:uncharacterized protein YecT (DUF1311 family)
MLVRHLPSIALALVSVVACNTPDRGSANDASAAQPSASQPSASGASVDTTPVTTHDMVEALSRDVNASERNLAATEDSFYVFMGDTVAVMLKRAHASWAQYRKLECDAIKVAFTEGSMAPVAQMECWINLTDGHRKFITEEYDYMRNGGPPPGRPPR